MNAHTVIAQAGTTTATAPSGAPKIVKVVKPQADQAVTLELGYGQNFKLDLSSIANEKVKYIHKGENLIIQFDNKSTVTVHPFFDSMGVPLQNVSVEVAPGHDIASAQFISAFTAGNDNAQSIVKILKPATDQALTVELGYDQKVKIDLSDIANEKITLVHIGEKLIIL